MPKNTKKLRLSGLCLSFACSVLGACSPETETLVPPPQAEPALPVSRSSAIHQNMWVLKPLASTAAFDRPEQVAWATLRYVLPQPVVRTARLFDLHDAGNGPLIARFSQEVDGVPVFLRTLSVAMNRNQQPMLWSGQLEKYVRPLSTRFDLSPAVAVEAAVGALWEGRGFVDRLGSATSAAGGYTQHRLWAKSAAGKDRGAFLASRSKKVYFPTQKGLAPAYYVELDGSAADSTTGFMYAFVVSAQNGAVLFAKNLSEDAGFTYRVYADGAPGYVPWDGPQGNGFSPHPKAAPDGSGPSSTNAALVALEHVPFSRNDPWLPEDAQELSGNNAWTYVDHTAPDGFNLGDLSITETGPGVFDRAFDPGTSPPSANDHNKRAAATQFFYVVNYLHDVFYDAGWTESAQNPQRKNYGRGGLEADQIRLEAQDSSGRNNANASTPADGAMPRIQMYLWDASFNGLQITAPASVAAQYSVGGASFGPQKYSVSGDVVAALDLAGTAGSTTDACEAITNAAALAGKIALIDRGNCPYVTKVKNAQTAGAIGALVVNNIAGSGAMKLGGTDATIAIAAQGMGNADGAKLRAAAETATVSAQIKGAGSERDSSLDGTIVAHEWAHVLSNRLIGNGSGLGNNQGRSMGEGFSDFVALLMTVRKEDAAVPANAQWSGTYGTGSPSVYTEGNNAYYHGIRRYPYSTDKAKNPLTFKHIENGVKLPDSPPPAFGADGSSNAEVHGSGEVWATALWECYAALLRDGGRLTFEQAQARMQRYLVAGLKLTPMNPTFTEARDALLFAAFSSDKQDYDLFVDAFAKRGLGAGAVSPDRMDAAHKGTVESFQTGPELSIDPNSLMLDTLSTSCDGDGVFDGGEAGHLSFRVRNLGNKTAQNGSVKVVAEAPMQVQGTQSTTVPLANLNPFEETTARISVSLPKSATPVSIELSVTATADGALVSARSQATYRDLGNYDMGPETSNVDTFNGRPTLWKVANDDTLDTSESWTLVTQAQATLFHGPDTAAPSDHSLISPPIAAGPGDFVLAFRHRYRFETDTTPTYWDGAVVEISTDDGRNWADAKDVPGVKITNGYSGTIQNTTPTANPLLGRPAFVGASAGFATGNFVESRFLFGSALANQTVRFRFRIGTDDAVGEAGWDIDEVAVTGAQKPPFLLRVAQPQNRVCRSFSVTQPDLLNIPTGSQVVLEPTVMNAPGPVGFTWTQIDGTHVDLVGAGGEKVSFVAPAAPTVIGLKWSATSLGVVQEGTVHVHVVQAAVSSASQARGCSLVGPVAQSAWLGWVCLGLLPLFRFRRHVRKQGSRT